VPGFRLALKSIFGGFFFGFVTAPGGGAGAASRDGMSSGSGGGGGGVSTSSARARKFRFLRTIGERAVALAGDAGSPLELTLAFRVDNEAIGAREQDEKEMISAPLLADTGPGLACAPCPQLTTYTPQIHSITKKMYNILN